MDTLSRLIEINPDIALPAEQPGQEFRYNFFEDLPPVEVGEIIIEGVEIKLDPDTFLKEINLNLPLKPRSIKVTASQGCQNQQHSFKGFR